MQIKYLILIDTKKNMPTKVGGECGCKNNQEGGAKKKRKKSEYNLFMSVQLKKLKEKPENKNKKQKEIFALAVAEWRKTKKN